MPDIRRTAGLGSGGLIGRLLGADRDRGQGSAVNAAHKVLHGTYCDRLPAFEGAGGLLSAPAGRDWRVVLATSASGPEPAALCRAAGRASTRRDAESDSGPRVPPCEGPGSRRPVAVRRWRVRSRG
jgi:hypothetical protein